MITMLNTVDGTPLFIEASQVTSRRSYPGRQLDNFYKLPTVCQNTLNTTNLLLKIEIIMHISNNVNMPIPYFALS